MTDAHTPGTIWGCKIGLIGARPLPGGCDAPMRRAVKEAFLSVVGEDAEFTFSGWSGTLTEPEMSVVENRLPDPAHYAAERLRDAAPDLLEAAKSGFLALVGLEMALAVERNAWEWPDDAPPTVPIPAERLRAAILKATSTEQGERG